MADLVNNYITALLGAMPKAKPLLDPIEPGESYNDQPTLAQKMRDVIHALDNQRAADRGSVVITPNSISESHSIGPVISTDELDRRDFHPSDYDPLMYRAGKYSIYSANPLNTDTVPPINRGPVDSMMHLLQKSPFNANTR